MAAIAPKRLGKELKELKQAGCPVGICLLQADDFECWKLSIEVLGNTLYKGQVFAVQFRFAPSYPITSPEVTFLIDGGYEAPLHPHVYSNGHICASILGNEWSPVLSVQGVCVTLQSMLASCTKLERPPGNDSYVRHAPKSPKNARFIYDDDTV